MAYFPKIGPFFDPKNDHEFYGEQDGRLRLRQSRERRDSGTGASLKESRAEKNPQQQQNHTNDCGWSDVVQEQGSLFYVAPTPDPRLYHPAGSTEHNSHSRQNSDLSGPSYSPRYNGTHTTNSKQHYRQNSNEYEALRNSGKSNSGNPLNQRHLFPGNFNSNSDQGNRSRQVQFNRSDNDRQSGGSATSDQSYTTFSKYLDSDADLVRTSQRLPEGVEIKSTNINNGHAHNTPFMNVSQSGKRKSICMVPNHENIREDFKSLSGVELCEKLFGIRLCHYKQRRQRSTDSSVTVDQVPRDRKVIVQGVIVDSQADTSAQIHRGDMLVAINDMDITWANIDEHFKHAALLQKVKLTFQVPLVVGPKVTPPVTPTHSTSAPVPPHTPPLPPHVPLKTHPTPPVPLRIPLTLPPRPPLPCGRPPPPCGRHPSTQDLVRLTTGYDAKTVRDILRKHILAVMYLTPASQTQNSKDDVIYQYPIEDNKLTDIRGLFLTLGALTPDITSNRPKQTCLSYHGEKIHVSYWREGKDTLLTALPDSKVPALCAKHILAHIVHTVNLLYGAGIGVFRDESYHGPLNELVSLTLYGVLMAGVMDETIGPTSPLEPLLLDTLSAMRWLALSRDDKISCDEILSEYEAQDYMESEDVHPDERRQFAILGSCLFFKEYLLCSHLYPEDLCDVYMYLKYHCILHLVNKQPVEDLVIWREIYPTHLGQGSDNHGYREPGGRWFLLVVGMRHFLHCSILKTGSYACQMSGRQEVNAFIVDQSQTTIMQLQADDTNIEHQCNLRLTSESIGPSLKCIEPDRQPSRPSGQINDVSPVKSPTIRNNVSPKFGGDDVDRVSLHSPDGPVMRRQGSRLSYGSNDSNTSSGSASHSRQMKSVSKKGSVYDITTLDRSFSHLNAGKSHKLISGIYNTLLHYVNFDSFEGVFVSPSPMDQALLQGPIYQHVLYNFYGSALKLNKMFQYIVEKKHGRNGAGYHGIVEEAVMFTCQLGQGDTHKHPTTLMYWVIGRLFNGHKMFICLEDGAPQTLQELAFNYNFGYS